MSDLHEAYQSSINQTHKELIVKVEQVQHGDVLNHPPYTGTVTHIAEVDDFDYHIEAQTISGIQSHTLSKSQDITVMRYDDDGELSEQ